MPFVHSHRSGWESKDPDTDKIKKEVICCRSTGLKTRPNKRGQECQALGDKENIVVKETLTEELTFE